jgi:hypothetical protein
MQQENHQRYKSAGAVMALDLSMAIALFRIVIRWALKSAIKQLSCPLQFQNRIVDGTDTSVFMVQVQTITQQKQKSALVVAVMVRKTMAVS